MRYATGITANTLEELRDKLERKYQAILDSPYDECDIYAVTGWDIQVIDDFVFCIVHRLTIWLVDVYDINGDIVYQYDYDDKSIEDVLEELRA